MERYTPNQVAGMLQVSTTTLRRYEDQDLIPAVPRTPSNHRYYEEVHVQAFTTIRVLLQGYDIPVAYEVMRSMKQGQTEQALWLINGQQYEIHLEMKRVEDILAMIRHTDIPNPRNTEWTTPMNIGEAAAIAGVRTSAIRHWEAEGLIRSERNPENGFRMFTLAELRKILLISSLRKTVYYIDNMRSLLSTLDTQDHQEIERTFQVALEKLNTRLMLQCEGIAEVMSYMKLLSVQK
ncbi:MerR family DNA-binding transcriptional regulator [Paenibacillus piscarius]|uniref:MerR family DNA-binding transcriptional regulator n=1 Tax=Paenibacillus piscarius TaxID=1089681 RepID=UPI001EE7B872